MVAVQQAAKSHLSNLSPCGESSKISRRQHGHRQESKPVNKFMNFLNFAGSLAVYARLDPSRVHEDIATACSPSHDRLIGPLML